MRVRRKKRRAETPPPEAMSRRPVRSIRAPAGIRGAGAGPGSRARRRFGRGQDAKSASATGNAGDLPWVAADSGADGPSAQTPPERMQPVLTEEEEGYLLQLQRLQAEFRELSQEDSPRTRRLGCQGEGRTRCQSHPRSRRPHPGARGACGKSAERRGGGSASDPLASRGSRSPPPVWRYRPRPREPLSIRTFMRRSPARRRTSIPRGRSSRPCSRGISSAGSSCAPRGCGSHRVHPVPSPDIVRGRLARVLGGRQRSAALRDRDGHGRGFGNAGPLA